MKTKNKRVKNEIKTISKPTNTKLSIISKYRSPDGGMVQNLYFDPKTRNLYRYTKGFLGEKGRWEIVLEHSKVDLADTNFRAIAEKIKNREKSKKNSVKIKGKAVTYEE